MRDRERERERDIDREGEYERQRVWFPHCVATYTEWQQILYGEYRKANQYTVWRHTLYGEVTIWLLATHYLILRVMYLQATL